MFVRRVHLLVWLAVLTIGGTVSVRAQEPGPDVLPEHILPPQPPPPPPEHAVLISSWTNGLWFKSSDDSFSIHVGGNVQVDAVWFYSKNSAFALPNGTISGVGNAPAADLRRVRLKLDGTIFEQFDYNVEYDLANAANENSGLQDPNFGNIAGQPSPCSIWMQVRDVPYLGDVRIGNVYKPIGFTNNVSQSVLNFLERPDTMDAFYGPFDNGYILGVVSRNQTENRRLFWQYGIYRPANDVFAVALNVGGWGGRAVALPVYENEGRSLVHFGMGTLNGELPQDQLRVRARPLLRNGPGYANPVLVDTGPVGGSRQYTLAPEFAAVMGPVTIQAEWTGQYLTEATPPGGANGGANQGTIFYHGGYAELLYFLTGEYQRYDKAEYVFGRVIPNQNLRFKRGEGCTGPGAWQIGLRFGYLDLNDKAIQGGTLYDWTFGLNWFWTPNMKLQLNYILERRDQPGVPAAWISGLGVRGGFDF